MGPLMAKKMRESRSRIHRLTPRFVETVKVKGMYPDGGGLYLQVGEGGGAKSWLFRYNVEGRDRQMGLGPLHTIGLAEARERARKRREQRLDGIDPIEARKADRLTQRLAATKQVTFETCAKEWLDRSSPGWEPGTTRNQRILINKYLNPVLGKLLVNVINVDLVESAIKPIWDTTQSRGKKVQKTLEALLGWATAKEYRAGDNPASMEGALGLRLSPYVHTETNLASLPYQEIGAFMAELRAYRNKRWGRGERTLSSYVLEFVILTAVRHHQVRDLRWQEINEDNKLWTCQVHKTLKKTKQPYVIPLSEPAMAILTTMRERQAARGTSDFVFVHGPRVDTRPSRLPLPSHAGKRMHGPALVAFLQDTLGRPDLTVHGFRTTFSTWAHEHDFPGKDIEKALGHIVGDGESEMERRYNRAKRLEPRRLLMDAWAEYCGRAEPLPVGVVPFRQQAK